LRSAELGATGVAISVIGLGTWPMGGGEGDLRWAGGDEARSTATIHRALERGINWIDTAPVYGGGRSEEIVGKALRAVPAADRPLVFSKCGLRLAADGTPVIDLRPEALRAECESSLRRLGTERLDLLQIHWPGDDDDALATAWHALEQLRIEGKIRLAGASNFTLEQLEVCSRIAPVASLQSALSVIERRALPIFAASAQRSIGGLAYSVLQSGLLSGRFTAESLAGGDWRRDSPVRFEHQLNFREPALSRNLALAGRLAVIAEDAGATVSALALAWATSWPGVNGALAAARTPEKVDEWAALGASDELDSATLARLAEAIAESGAGSGPNPEPR
jgi:aryl-alcohol dehydrogenase-like predicted oxidoreductase